MKAKSPQSSWTLWFGVVQALLAALVGSGVIPDDLFAPVLGLSSLATVGLRLKTDAPITLPDRFRTLS